MDKTKASLTNHSPDAKDILQKEDKYKVEDLLARGGMAMVFKAKDKNCRRTVALKVIQEGGSENKEIIHRFIEEAQIAAQLDHPNILPVYELNIDQQNNPFYTMKLVKGDTLEQVLLKLKEKDKDTIAQYPLSKLIQVYTKICEAIAFSSARGVIHRDLKPENIMIGEFGEVFIMDWGVAKVMKNGEIDKQISEKEIDELIETISKDRSFNISTTMQGQILGTPGFMAPEQAWSAKGPIGTHTDVYALGGILFNILTLEMPHEEIDLRTLLKNKVAGNIPTPEKRVKNKAQLIHIPKRRIPSALSSICQKAMNNEPKKRYRDASGILTDLNLYLNGFATQAEGASQFRLLQLLFMRHKTLAYGLSILLVMVPLLLTQNYFKLVTAQVESETAESFADEVAKRTSKSADVVRHMKKSASSITDEMESQIASLIANNELPRAYKVCTNMLHLAKSPQLFIYKAQLLMKFSKPLEASRTVRRALVFFPGNKDVTKFADSMQIKYR